jgi:hypothetical protein
LLCSIKGKDQKWGMAMMLRIKESRVSDAWHRRQAVAVASTLPEDIEDARIILQLAMELLDGFLADGEPAKPVTGALASQPRPADA